MSLISDLPKLAELAKQQASGEYKTIAPEFQYECEMLNVAPVMLQVLRKIREGDAELLEWMKSGKGDFGNDDDIQDRITDLLDRLLEACQLMEAEGK
jgi:hypothetical protein